MIKYRTFPMLAAVLTAMVLVMAACGGGDSDEEAVNLSESYDEFAVVLASNEDITTASDDAKDTLNDECDDIQDGVDDGDVEDFCDDLEAAIDDEDQAEYARLRTEFAAVEPLIVNEIREQVGEAVDENTDDDDPLQGGDDNNDDDGGVDNPLDDDNNDDDGGVDNPLDDDNN
jgi:hypothetical protein